MTEWPPMGLEEDAGTSGGLFGLPNSPGPVLVVLPVPFEGTVSYRQGTSRAPEAIVAESAQIDLFDPKTDDAWRAGLALAQADPDVVDWDKSARALRAQRRRPGLSDGERSQLDTQIDGVCRRVVEAVYGDVEQILVQRQIPAVLGGEHSVALGAVSAAARRFGALSVLQIDAHADLRDTYEGLRLSHACVMRRVLEETSVDLHQVGVRDLCASEWAFAREHRDIWGVDGRAISAQRLSRKPFSVLIEKIVAPMGKRVWISLDIDGLEPGLCPGTGTPVPGGLTWDETIALLEAVVDSGRHIVGFDICEVGSQQWDAIVAARLLFKLCGLAIASTPVQKGVQANG